MKRNHKHTILFEKFQSNALNEFLKHQSYMLSKANGAFELDNINEVSAILKIEKQSLNVFQEYSKCQNQLFNLYLNKNNNNKVCISEDNLKKSQSSFISEDTLKSFPINRYEVKLKKVSLSKDPLYTIDSRGKVLVLGRQNKNLIEWINTKGLEPLFVPDESSYVDIEKMFDNVIVGVIGITDENWNEEQGFGFVKEMFFAAKHLSNVWLKNHNKPFFIAITRLGGQFGINSNDSNFITGSVSGLCKTASREWSTNIVVRYLDVPKGTSDSQLVSYMEDEIIYGEDVEVGRLINGERVILTLEKKYDKKISPILPCSDDVFLVSGGGRGVTAICIIELARRYHCNFILIDRTRLKKEPLEFANAKTLLQLRNILIKQKVANGEKVVLAEIDAIGKDIIAQRDVRKTLEELKSVGSKVILFTGDVKKIEDLKQAIKQGNDTLGPVTGIIHGAGVIHDKLLNKKTEEDFQSVFGVKYYGIKNMLKVVDIKKIKHIVLFSSIAGFFGNFGQADYSAANEYLNHFARYWKSTHPACNIMSINWGPWDAGMVDHALKHAMVRRGKLLIKPDVGSMFFVDTFEKLHGSETCQIIINDKDELGGAL